MCMCEKPSRFLTIHSDPVLLLEASKAARAKALDDIRQYCCEDMALVFDKLLPTDVRHVIAWLKNSPILLHRPSCLGSVMEAFTSSQCCCKTARMGPLPALPSAASSLPRSAVQLVHVPLQSCHHCHQNAKVLVSEEVRGQLSPRTIRLDNNCVRVSKGPITLALPVLNIVDPYLFVCIFHVCLIGFHISPLQSGERRVRVKKVLDTVDEIKWA